MKFVESKECLTDQTLGGEGIRIALRLQVAGTGKPWAPLGHLLREESVLPGFCPGIILSFQGMRVSSVCPGSYAHFATREGGHSDQQSHPWETREYYTQRRETGC